MYRYTFNIFISLRRKIQEGFSLHAIRTIQDNANVVSSVMVQTLFRSMTSDDRLSHLGPYSVSSV